MLLNSTDHFLSTCEFRRASPQFNSLIVQTATKKFMEAVEYVILYPTTSPVVRERLMDVLAAAAFTFHGPGKEGFQSTWRRVRPPTKPEDGIPFDKDDAMFDPTQGNRSRNLTSPVPQVTYVNTPNSPQVPRPSTVRQDSAGRQRPNLPKPPKPDRGLIPPDEDIRRLFEECEVALYGTRILNEALAFATPETFRRNPVIKVWTLRIQWSGKLTNYSRNTMQSAKRHMP